MSSLLPIIKQRYPDQETQTKAINVAQKALDEKRKIIIEQGAGEYFINLDQKLNQDYLEQINSQQYFNLQCSLHIWGWVQSMKFIF